MSQGVTVPEDSEDVLRLVDAWLAAGRRVALATVLETTGSAPRPAGSQLAVNDAMEMAGSVSGGCVEAATVREALAALEDGRPRQLAFGLSSDDAFEIGLTCGGKIRVYVESVSREHAFVQRLLESRRARTPVVVATALGSGTRFVLPDEERAVDARLVRAAGDAARADASRVVELGDGEWFLHVRNPAPRLVIVGAVHIAQTLAPMAVLNGFDVTVVDPREAFAAPARFPGTAVVPRFPHDVMDDLGIDATTAVVALSHNTRIDDAALVTALRRGAFYVGALGSRRSHAARLERLAALQLSSEQLARIHGPVGLAIGARTTAEIATAILAEMIQARRSRAIAA